MAQQLPLLDRPKAQPEWRIDEQTKAIGRRGLALARAALAATAAPDHDDHHDHDDQHDHHAGPAHQHRSAA